MNTSLIKNVLGQSNVAALQVGALVVFLLLFVSAIFWVFWPGSRAYYEKVAHDLVKGDSDGR
jgi:hypothetical protein